MISSQSAHGSAPAVPRAPVARVEPVAETYFGQTIVDWYDGLKAPKNAFWVESGDAQGFFDLLTERLPRLQ